MNKKELKPKIRFKNCLDNWNKKQLNNIVERLDNLRVPITENRREKGNTPYYGANGIQDYVKGCTHKGNNILIAEDGANDLTNYPVYFVSGNIWVNNHTHVIKSNNENEYDNLFLSMSLKTVNYESIVSGSSRVKLTAKQLMNIETFIPDIKEQKSIGEFFDKIDKSIKQSEKKVEKWKNIRTSLLSKMFPKEGKKVPELRFKGFSGEWEEIGFKEIVESVDGGISIEHSFTKNGKYKVISIGSYSEESRYIDQGLRVNIDSRIKDKILKKDDLTMILNDKTQSGRIIGRVLLIDQDDKYVYNQRTERIRINKDKFNPLFIYYLLNSDLNRKKIIEISQGNTQIYVNWSSVEKIKYIVPLNIKEQIIISNFLKTLDNYITAEQLRVRKLNLLKKAFLNKMFV